MDSRHEEEQRARVGAWLRTRLRMVSETGTNTREDTHQSQELQWELSTVWQEAAEGRDRQSCHEQRFQKRPFQRCLEWFRGRSNAFPRRIVIEMPLCFRRGYSFDLRDGRGRRQRTWQQVLAVSWPNWVKVMRAREGQNASVTLGLCVPVSATHKIFIVFQDIPRWGSGGMTAFKNTHCSYRRSKFSFSHPHQVSNSCLSW